MVPPSGTVGFVDPTATDQGNGDSFWGCCRCDCECDRGCGSVAGFQVGGSQVGGSISMVHPTVELNSGKETR